MRESNKFRNVCQIILDAELPPLQPLPALEQKAVSAGEYLMSLPVEMQARDSKLETEPKAQHDLGCRLCFQHVIVKDSEHMQNYYRHAKHATHTRMVTHVADDGALRPLLDGVKGIWGFHGCGERLLWLLLVLGVAGKESSKVSLHILQTLKLLGHLGLPAIVGGVDLLGDRGQSVLQAIWAEARSRVHVEAPVCEEAGRAPMAVARLLAFGLCSGMATAWVGCWSGSWSRCQSWCRCWRRRWSRWCWSCADLGVTGVAVDATDVAAGADLPVAFVAPGRAPTVLDEEVTCRAVVTHGEHTVVEVGAAARSDSSTTGQP